MKSKSANAPNGGAEKTSWFSWQAGLGLAITAFFLWLAFRRIPLGDLIGRLKEVGIAPMLVAISIVLASVVLRGWRWKLMLSPSAPGLRRRDAIAATMVGYAVNVAIPRGGEVARAVFLKRIARTSLAAGISSVLAERLLDVVSLCILFVLTLAFYQHRLDEIFPDVGRAMFFAAFAASAGLAVAWAIGRYPERAAGLVRRILEKVWPSRAERFSVMGENFFTGFRGMFIRENTAGVILLSVGIWVLYIAANWAVAAAFSSGKLSSLSFLDAAAITVVVAISLTIPAPGGIGTTHFFVSKMLTTIYAIDPAEALAYATLLHLSGVIPLLVLGALFSLILRPAKTAPGS